MPLLQSLFCFKGYDNGRRFLIINIACYLLFILLSSALAKAPVLLALLVLICTPILLTSAIRRAHDANFGQWLSILPIMVFLLNLFGITYIEHIAAWGLLILAIFVTAGFGLFSQPGIKRNFQYTFGYFGPIDFAGNKSQSFKDFQRIEPTLAAQQNEKQTHGDDLFFNQPLWQQASVHQPQSNQNIEASHLSNWISQNPKALIGAGITIVISIVFVGLLLTMSEPEQTTEETNNKPEIFIKERIAKISMPDNFWVMLDQNNALTIAWQGDVKQDGEVWSALTGLGDNTCVDVSFNRQLKFRAMQVEVKNNGDYYADFSPVDTKALVESIAKRSNFKLCGYEFSLKGTQARLMTNNKYRGFLIEEL